MKMSKQNPMDLVTRVLFLEQLNKLSPSDVKKINVNMVVEYEEEDENGNTIDIIDIDWKYCIFSASLKEFEILFDNFVPVKKGETDEFKIKNK